MSRAFLYAAAVAAVACHTARDPGQTDVAVCDLSADADSDPYLSQACTENPAVVQYLEVLHAQSDPLCFPASLSDTPDEFNSVLIRIRQDGSIRCLTVLSESMSEERARFMKHCVLDSAPFPPLTEETECLLEENFVVVFPLEEP